jgi:hypothetical protein
MVLNALSAIRKKQPKTLSATVTASMSAAIFVPCGRIPHVPFATLSSFWVVG